MQANVVKSLERVDILSDYILWWLWIAIALEEDKDAAILLLEALPEQNLVDINIFLLLSHHLKTHPFWVEVISIGLKTRIAAREVQLMGYFLMLVRVAHFLEVRPEEANIFDQRVSFHYDLLGNWSRLLSLIIRRVYIREVLLHGKTIIDSLRPHLELLNKLLPALLRRSFAVTAMRTSYLLILQLPLSGLVCAPYELKLSKLFFLLDLPDKFLELLVFLS